MFCFKHIVLNIYASINTNAMQNFISFFGWKMPFIKSRQENLDYPEGCNSTSDSLFITYVSLFYSISEQRTTQQGQVYFLHTRTGVSTWHDPRVPR